MAGPAPSLFGLAPNGVCRACRIAAASGGLLLHRFTLTACAAVCFLWRCPRVAPPGRYPASCPAEPGLSSPGLAARSDDPSRSRRKIQNILSLKRFAFQTLRPVLSRKNVDFSPLGIGGVYPFQAVPRCAADSSRISLKKRAGEGMGAWGEGNTLVR